MGQGQVDEAFICVARALMLCVVGSNNDHIYYHTVEYAQRQFTFIVDV